MGFRGGEGERRKREGGDGKGRCGKRAEIGGGPREEGSEGERGGEREGGEGLGSTLEHINCRATGYIETGWGGKATPLA